MVDNKMLAAIEEYRTAETIEEVRALDREHHEAETFCGDVVDASDEAHARFAPTEEPVVPPTSTPDEQIAALIKVQADMQAQIKALMAASMKTAVGKNKVARTDKKYKLLSTDVSWTNKPQVHALMAIVGLTMKVGETVYESDIIKVVVENEAVLNTVQGGKKIWNYYKGDTADGFIQHGNFVIVP